MLKRSSIMACYPRRSAVARRDHRRILCYLTGSDPCNACKNCNYCKHCAKEGGTCGLCKRKANPRHDWLGKTLDIIDPNSA